MAAASNTLLCHTFSTCTDGKLAHTVASPLLSPWCCNYSANSITAEPQWLTSVPYLVLGLCDATWLGRGASWSWCSPLSWSACTPKKTRGLFNSGWNCDDSEVVRINGVDESGQGGEMGDVYLYTCIYCIWCLYMCDLLSQLVSGQV